MRRWIVLQVFGFVLSGCVVSEGDDVGECTDRADNDRDGLFDCDDPDCFGSPDCVDDDDADDDTGSDGDDDTGDDDTGSDGDDTADDDTGSGGDDDVTTAPVDYAGNVAIAGEEHNYGLTIFCVGQATALVDFSSGAVVGEGVCHDEDFERWEGLQGDLTFECQIDANAVSGLMVVEFKDIVGTLLPPVELVIGGVYLEPEATFDLTLVGDEDESFIAEGQMSLAPVDPGGPAG